MFQAFVERRRGAETGGKSVQWVGQDDMWDAVDSGMVRRDLLDAVLAATPKYKHSSFQPVLRKTRGDHVGLFLFEYNDGLKGAILTGGRAWVGPLKSVLRETLGYRGGALVDGGDGSDLLVLHRPRQRSRTTAPGRRLESSRVPQASDLLPLAQSLPRLWAGLGASVDILAEQHGLW